MQNKNIKPKAAPTPTNHSILNCSYEYAYDCAQLQ